MIADACVCTRVLAPWQGSLCCGVAKTWVWRCGVWFLCKISNSYTEILRHTLCLASVRASSMHAIVSAEHFCMPWPVLRQSKVGTVACQEMLHLIKPKCVFLHHRFAAVKMPLSTAILAYSIKKMEMKKNTTTALFTCTFGVCLDWMKLLKKRASHWSHFLYFSLPSCSCSQAVFMPKAA